MILPFSKKLLLVLVGALVLVTPSVSFAFIPLICDLCTVWVVAGLAVSRYFGVDDSVVGVWIGALLVALIVMTNAYLEKKNIKFRFRNTIIAVSFVVFTAISFYYAKIIAVPRHSLLSSGSMLADKIVISSIVGAAVLVASSILYQWLKAKNGGKAHFPFEKVALPLIALILASTAFYFVTLR